VISLKEIPEIVPVKGVPPVLKKREPPNVATVMVSVVRPVCIAVSACISIRLTPGTPTTRINR